MPPPATRRGRRRTAPGATTAEVWSLSRTASDGAIAGRLAAALERFGYPWAGTSDPHEFTLWVDRSPNLEARVHELLRRRRRALDDGRTGTAEEARDALIELGVVVRDRDGRQEYRLVTD